MQGSRSSMSLELVQHLLGEDITSDAIPAQPLLGSGRDDAATQRPECELSSLCNVKLGLSPTG